MHVATNVSRARRRAWTSTALIATVVVAGLTAAPTRSSAATVPVVTVLGSAAQVRPTTPTPAGRSDVAISAARNEFESFQVVVDAGTGAVPRLVATAGPLTGPGGASIPAGDVTVYRESWYTATQASDADGGTGAWADALVPKVDPFYGETRNAFPVDVPAGGKVAVWVDVFAPSAQAAGRYTGTLALDADGFHATVPVSLTVEPFTLPPTTSVASGFLLSPYAACSAHPGTGCVTGSAPNEAGWALQSLYARAALEDRIGVTTPWPVDATAPPVTGQQRTWFDQYVKPLLNGSTPHDTAGLWKPMRLQGAKLTALTISSNSPDHPAYNCGGSCLTSWQQLATQDGFADRAALYACDEPAVDPSHRWDLCRRSIAERDARWPALPVLVTTSLAQAKASPVGDLSGGINTLVPIVQELHPRGAAGDTSLGTRPQYDSWLATAGSPPRRLWTYTSCVSFGCGAADEPGVGAWPGYAIDAAASRARAMGWLLYEYNVGGELYYEMAQNLRSAWTPGGLWFAGANGDGALFYPGTPTTIGGQHDIPLDTLRMKRIRDGREDNEYLRLAAKNHPSETAGIARGLFANPYSTSVSDAALQSARDQLTRLIVGPAQPGKVTLTSALSLSPATPVASSPVTASFTVTNSGGSPVTVGYFLAGARTSTGGHVDFPPSPAVTLQPGQSYTYTKSRTLPAGSYTTWPGYYDGSTWVELGPHTPFTVR